MILNELIVKNIVNLSRICPVKKIQIYNSEIAIVCKTKDLLDILLFLKKHVLCQFNLLSCISGVDYPKNKYRFKIVYELLSIRFNARIRVIVFTDELCAIDSSENMFSASGWYECEIWDMFGLFFKNHSNLKRILTDYGFEGYPLRKDYPLSGFTEIRYSDSKKRVVADSIELSQEYRTFKFLSPWENQAL